MWRRTADMLGSDGPAPTVDVRREITTSRGDPPKFFRLHGMTGERREGLGIGAYAESGQRVVVNYPAVRDNSEVYRLTMLAHEYAHVVQFRTDAFARVDEETGDTVDGRTVSDASEAERAAAYAAAQELMLAELPYIIPFYEDVLTAAQDHVQGYTINPINRYFYLENVWLEQE